MQIDKKNIVKELGKIDLYICSSGFENRSTNLSLSLNPDNINNSILFHLNETYNISLKNSLIIKEKIKSLEIVEYPKNNPLGTFDVFFFTLKKFKEKISKEEVNVVIDITTFTREILLILIKVISLDIFSSFNTKIVYTPNESYSIDGSFFWLTKGVREIRSIIGFSGLHSPSKKLLLIILNGFEDERTEQIIQCFEPNKLIIGKPSKDDSINQELNIISCKKFDHIESKFNNIIPLEKFEFSCTNIKTTEDILNSIIDINKDEYNIIISPLNNKISTVSVALVGLKREEIQICYASANQYNIDANGIPSNYFLVFDLNSLLKNTNA